MTITKHSQLIRPEWRGTGLVALSGFCYGFLGYLGTSLFQYHLSIPDMLFWRFFIAAWWMLLTTVFFKKIKILPTDRKTLLKIIAYGALCYGGSSGFYFIASQYIGTGLAMVIFFCYPVFVTLLALIAGTWKINKHALASLTIILIGLICLKGEGKTALDIMGIFLSILSGVCYAIYIYANRHQAKIIDSSLLTLLICLVTSIIFLIMACFTHSFTIPTTLGAWAYILALGIFATAIPIQLLLDGLKYISPIKASILSVLEPVVTLAVGFVALHEAVSFLQLMGALIVLAGAILIQFEYTPKDEYEINQTL